MMMNKSTLLGDDAKHKNSTTFNSHFAKLAEEKGFPFVSALELTHKCNFKCNMCYMRIDDEEYAKCLGGELTTKEWFQIIDDTYDLGTMIVILTGGEPLLRNDFMDIYEYIYSKGMMVSILTNASLINRQFVESLKDKKPLSISLTLYGASSETYERLCHNGNAYQQVIDAIKLLKEADIHFIVKNLVVEENEKDRYLLRELAEENKWRYSEGFFCDDVLPTVLRQGRRTIMCDDEEFQSNEIKNCKDNIVVVDDEKYSLVKEKTENILLQYKKKDGGFFCSAGSSRYWITWNGQLTPCALLDKPSIDIRKVGLKEGWQKLKEMVLKLGNPNDCMVCPYLSTCRRCPASHYRDTGCYGLRSDRVCNYNRLVLRRTGIIE